MNIKIRPLQESDIELVLELSILAWALVFQSFEQVLGPTIFKRLYPDWEKIQREEVEKVLRDREKLIVWVPEVEGKAVGFIAYTLDFQKKIGEIYMLAVHLGYQNRGIGTELNTFALGKLKESGMLLAEVGTGGDPGHAPARRSYEKAGYTALPLVRYYKAL